MRSVLIVLVLAVLAAVGFAVYRGLTLEQVLSGNVPGLIDQPAPPATPGPQEPPQPAAKLAASATMVAGRRIEIASQWTSDSGQAYLESMTVYYLTESGEIIRKIPFEVREMRAGYDFTRKFPLEPQAQLFGVCAVYSAAKNATRVRASALFMNKGEGEQSPMLAAAPPAADPTNGCFPAAR